MRFPSLRTVSYCKSESEMKRKRRSGMIPGRLFFVLRLNEVQICIYTYTQVRGFCSLDDGTLPCILRDFLDLIGEFFIVAIVRAVAGDGG